MKKTNTASVQTPLDVIGGHHGEAASSASKFEIRIRSINASAQSATVVASETPLEAIESSLKLDVTEMFEPVISWRDRRRLLALDFDRPEGEAPVQDHEVPSLFPDWLPQPYAAWRTHGSALRAVFSAVGSVDATALAGTWMLLAPLGPLAGFRVEAKTDTRHPSSPRGTETCGAVIRFEPSSHLALDATFNEAFAASEDEISGWMEEHGLQYGRHGAQFCPWCGDEPGACNPPVVVSDRGVKCHRCGQFKPWHDLVSSCVQASPLSMAARHLVHFAHQRYVLRHIRPCVPDQLLRPAWQHILWSVNADRLSSPDEGVASYWRARIARAASPEFDVVRGHTGAWLDAVTLEPREVAPGRTLRELPWAQSATMIDKANNPGPLDGFVPVEPVPASAVLAPHLPESVGIRVRRVPVAGEAPPVVLGSAPPSPPRVEEAWGRLREALPGLSRDCLSAIMVAILVAQRGVSTPPIITVTGPPGSGKNAHAYLAAGALGRRVGDVNLTDSTDVRRQIGLALELGSSPLVIDEVGRLRDPYHRLEVLLRLNSDVRFEAKYANERSVRVTAPVLLTGSTLPTSIVRSPEVSRRAVGYQLLDRAYKWDAHGELLDVRQSSALRGLIDVVIADVWWRLHALGPHPAWRSYCLEHLGAVEILELDNDGAAEGRDDVVRDLYEHYRIAPDGEFTTSKSWKGWLRAGPGDPAGALLGELVDLEADRKVRFGEMADLKRIDLMPVLGFDSPKLQLSVKERGRNVLVKFIELGCLRGRERARQELPSPSTEHNVAHDTHVAHTPGPERPSPTEQAINGRDLEIASCATGATGATGVSEVAL